MNKIKLFVLHDCQLCPQMEKIFKNMYESGAVNSLEVMDVAQHPELAKQYNIRSVPFYLINDVAFSGLKSATDIRQLLGMDETKKIEQQISQLLTEGDLGSTQELVSSNEGARKAMIQLLTNEDTELLIRIGLTAVFESLAPSGIFIEFEDQIKQMSEDTNERIAIDAMYYLSLMATEGSLKHLSEIAQSNASTILRDQAQELLEEHQEGATLH